MPNDQGSKDASIRKNSKNRTRGRRRKIFLGLLVSVACVWFVSRSVEREELLERLINVRLEYVALAILTTFASYLARSLRWPFFFEHSAPSFKASFDCVILGFFVNNILPARIGELVRAHLGGKATKLSRSTVLATVAAERLADGLVISLIFAGFFTLFSHVEHSDTVDELYWVAYFFLAASLGTFVFLLFRNRVFQLLERMQKIMPGNLSTYGLVRARYFIEGLAPLLHPGRLVLLLMLTGIVWSIELLAYYFVALAFSHPMKLGGLSLFLAAVNFSSLIPAAPAGAGVIEVFGTMALERIGIDQETGLAMVMTQHLIQFTVVGVPGVLLFLWRLGGRLPQADDETDPADAEVEAESPFVDVSEPRAPGEAPGSDPAGAGAIPPDTVTVDISIVIPAFNEEQRLPKTLLSIVEYFKTRSESHEILVVDDGSTDNTAQIVRQFEALSPNVRLLTYHRNRGKGYAVRFGMLNARGKLILFNDADGATPIAEIERLEGSMAGGVQVAIGSRAMYSRDTSVDTLWYRKFIGRTFNGIVNLLLLPGIADTQCGFKMFERKAARHIFSRQQAERFSFDCEVLFLARKSGCRIVEVPINWTNIPGSKVNLINDSLMMFVDLVKFRLRDFFGGYGELRNYE